MQTALQNFHGPWIYDPSSDQVSTQPAEGRPHGAVVASIGHHAGFNDKGSLGPLIAAAPELLAALQEVVNASHGLTMPSSAYIAAERAIARATVSKENQRG